MKSGSQRQVPYTRPAAAQKVRQHGQYGQQHQRPTSAASSESAGSAADEYGLDESGAAAAGDDQMLGDDAGAAAILAQVGHESSIQSAPLKALRSEANEP